MVTALLLALTVAAVAPVPTAHPLHSTITEISATNGAVRATIRVFADDFGTAVARSLKGRTVAAGAAWDAAAVAYVSASFTLTDGAGRTLPLRSCGIRRTADLYWVCVESAAPASLATLSVRNRLLCDVWDDQVNVVQANVAGTRRSLLFTKGDAAKPLT